MRTPLRRQPVRRGPIRPVNSTTRKVQTVRSRYRYRGKRRFSRQQRKSGGAPISGAQNRLKQFRQATLLAVAITGMLLMLLAPGDGEATVAQVDTTDTTLLQQLPDTVAIIEKIPVDSLLEAERQVEAALTADEDRGLSQAATDEALNTIYNLWEGFYSNLPKLVVALVALLLAWGLTRIINPLLRKAIGHWQTSNAVITLTSIAIWLFAIGLALSVVAGDIRALVGSLGLIGLALSWSLQTPIESFSGWLMNSFQGYYRVGDRILVGEVFGDVYRIDFLTTTVWEIGAPYRQGFVQAEQPTGRLVTFPNNEVLSGTIVNLTRDFPYVWDELAVQVANESDIRYAMQLMEKISRELLDGYMVAPAREYEEILQAAGLESSITPHPQVFVSSQESWTDINIRYLVGARERRKWKSELTLRITEELNKPVHANKILAVYPRQQVQFIRPNGAAYEGPF